MEKALQDSGLGVLDITEVLMAGGSSQMPVVQHFLTKLFEQAVITGEEAEYLIAIVGENPDSVF